MARHITVILVLAAILASGCGGDDEEASEPAEPAEPTVESVTACLEDAGLEVESESGEIEQLLVNGGETEGGSTVGFYADEAEATEQAEAAQNVTGGDVEQSGSVIAITQGGPESADVNGCIA